MRASRLMAVLITVVILFLTGCECDPETDAELCGEQACGFAIFTDRCGDEREIECGECSGDAECEENICVCDDDPTVLCEGAGLECGTHSIVDDCGVEQEVDCGGCEDIEDCDQGICECIGETEEELCAVGELDCGETMVTDGCGVERQIDCGGCPDPYECQADNVCDCEGESEEQLCDDNDIGCGTISVEDRCERTREIECGDCSSPNECVDNTCECVPESEEELCDIADDCGDLEVTDSCGDSRSIECDPCAEGDVTFGAVRDADTGELIDDAMIRVYEWPPPGGEHYTWMWSAGYRANDPDFSTTTEAGATDDINFEFATDESICIDDQIATLESQEWYRIVVDHPDYETGIYYRLHPGYSSGDCPTQCPASPDSGCNRQDFELWESDEPHPLRPNLVLDIRDMEDYIFQCAELPSDHEYDELIGLRVRLGAFNAGMGLFHMEATPGSDGDGEVLQYIEWSDGTQETHVVDSGTFQYHDTHNHIHFLDWFRMSLVEPIDDCTDVENRPSSCINHEGAKISYCLHDADPVDGDVMNQFDGSSPFFLDPPTCSTTEQGITQGWRDTYAKGIPGQVIIIGTPSDAADLDQQWLEAEVDPAHVLDEIDRDSNVGRLLIDVPDDLCNDPEVVLDCSMPPSQYTTYEQERNCGDYVNHDP